MTTDAKLLHSDAIPPVFVLRSALPQSHRITAITGHTQKILRGEAPMLT